MPNDILVIDAASYLKDDLYAIDVQLVLVDQQRGLYRVDVQQGTIDETGTTKSSSPTNHDGALKEFRRHETTHRGYERITEPRIPAGRRLIAESDERAVAAKTVARATAVDLRRRLPPAPIVDPEDRQIRKMIEGENWVAVLIPSEPMGFMKDGLAITLGGKPLPNDHPLHRIAEGIGGDFLMAGWMESERFHAFDLPADTLLMNEDVAYQERLALLGTYPPRSAGRLVIAPIAQTVEEKRILVDYINAERGRLQLRFFTTDTDVHEAEEILYGYDYDMRVSSLLDDEQR